MEELFYGGPLSHPPVHAQIICFNCKHWIEDFTCRSYPRGIPAEIYNGNLAHNIVFKDQLGPFIYEFIDRPLKFTVDSFSFHECCLIMSMELANQNKQFVRPYDLIKDRLVSDELFLFNSFEDIALRKPAGKYIFFAKPKGGNEYSINFSSQVVTEAIREATELSKEEYEKY
jgi:hypothetical protein